MRIEYYFDAKNAFYNFLANSNINDWQQYYRLYQDDIIQFVRKELNWNITPYFARIVNAKSGLVEWFYIIENGIEFHSSDTIEYNRMTNVEQAINNAIVHLFTNIINV